MKRGSGSGPLEALNELPGDIMYMIFIVMQNALMTSCTECGSSAFESVRATSDNHIDQRRPICCAPLDDDHSISVTVLYFRRSGGCTVASNDGKELSRMKRECKI